MTKLNGTSGQLFSVIAESINTRGMGGMARSGKGTGMPGSKDSSFHDLMHTVSNLARQALGDQEHDGPVKSPGTLRARLAQLTERDEVKHEGDDAQTPNKTAVSDQTPKAEVRSQPFVPSIVGQELAAASGLKPQTLAGGDDAAPRRTERSSAPRELQGTRAAAAAESGPQPIAAASTPQPGGPPAPKSMPADPGFEAVTANIEHAAKVSGRQALPEATKVTVVQQETHLPPVPQFTATQQVANAVVAELDGSPARAVSATPDLAVSQSNAPDQPLKILTISLEPPALGNVTVRLRLVGEAVSVHLAAERKDTSQMLDQQRDSIRDLMQSAGYVADVAPVQHGSLDGFQAGSGQSQSSFSGQQPSPNAQGAPGDSGASSGQSQGDARQARQERQSNQETRHDQDLAPRNRRGPVYL
jgi:chemotaxis protein MotD